MHFCCLGTPGLWDFVTAAQMDGDRHLEVGTLHLFRVKGEAVILEPPEKGWPWGRVLPAFCAPSPDPRA